MILNWYKIGNKMAVNWYRNVSVILNLVCYNMNSEKKGSH